MTYFLPVLFLASPVAAEFSITEGSYFKVRGSYEHTTDSFTNIPPAGEADACFQIIDVDPIGGRFDYSLISGDFSPWWSDEVLKPGFTDTFVDFPDSGWRIQNPDGDWATFLSRLHETVPSCPAPTS